MKKERGKRELRTIRKGMRRERKLEKKTGSKTKG